MIRTVPSITINDYTKGMTLSYEEPESANVELTIDKGKYFAFEEKSIDRIQSDLNLMNMWATDASEQMQIQIDSDVLAAIPSQAAAANAGNTAGVISGDIVLGDNTTPLAATKLNVLDILVDYGTVLDEQNVPNNNRWVVMPAKMCGLIKKSELRDASVSGDSGNSTLRNGRLGMLDRFTIYMSNQVAQTEANEYDVMFGHKSALTFASQATEMEDLPNPTDFGKLIRGLQVFGFETIKPDAMGHSVITL